MTKVIIPRGYVWFRDAAEDFRWHFMETQRRLEASHIRDKNWDFDTIQKSLAVLQIALVNEDLIAFVFGEEDIEKIPRGFWAKEDREAVIERGMLAFRSSDEMPIFIQNEAYKIFRSRFDFESEIDVNNIVDSKISNKSLYITPFIDLMLKATEKYMVTENHAPPVAILKAWFLDQKLPSGVSISQNQARMMATFSRPPERMKGGHYKSENERDE